ncbi:MAG: hypothetical protein ACM33T_15585 [Solirubrobacterales bacterium]
MTLSPSLRLTAFGAALFGAVLTTAPARADFKVHSPIVEHGEIEVEHSGALSKDNDPAKDKGRSFTTSIGYGVTEKWFTEFEGEWAREAGEGEKQRFDAAVWSNTLQIFDQGSRWLELGVLAEYEIAGAKDGADKITFGPLLQKELGPLTATVNLLLEKEIGANSAGGTEFAYGTQVKWGLAKEFEPAIEVYGEMGEVNNMKAADKQDHRAGPVLLGKFGLGAAGEIGYEVGYLVGLTDGAPQHTVKYSLEYGIAF